MQLLASASAQAEVTTLRAAMCHVVAKGVRYGVLAVAALAVSGIAIVPAQAAGPAYTWKNAKIGGTGYVTGMIAHPKQQGLYYARTDVGGAYRYDAATSTWIPLNDWAPPALSYINGIDSIAFDPNDANKLYIMGGIGFGNGTDNKAGFMSSTNQGRSFALKMMPFSTGGNESGRQVGERLAVDPNRGDTLFYGTANASVNASTNGLWKSSDAGVSWFKVGNFPALSNDDLGAGVAFIAFHKGSGWNNPANTATPILYAGVNTKAAADSGAILYKSSDGGNSWTRLWGGPSGMLPQRGQIGPDGYLYITFSKSVDASDRNNYGPNGLNEGQVWKVNVLSGADEWTNITPLGNSPKSYGFVGLSVDPAHPATVTVNTMNWYHWSGVPMENMYRTTDGGATWTDVWANATLDTSASPWASTNGPVTNFGNWGGSLLDPYDPNHAFISFGGGIWETKNLSQPRTNWAYGHNGVEESAILNLISPVPNEWNAYPVISGIGDTCGFVHTNVNQAPQSMFSGPTCKDTWGLDYAKLNSKIVVRVSTDDWKGPSDRHFGAVSWNGGYSWSAFPSNGPGKGGGEVAIAADGSTILWSAWDTPTVSSTDYGANWRTVSAVPVDARIVADGSEPNVFYAYDRLTGAFYFTNDKAVTWWQTNADSGNNGLPSWGDKLVAPLGRPGEVWLVSFTGLYRNTGWGWGSWTKLPNVESARALGFGQAAPGSNYPAMYLSGTVNGVMAIHRSIDAGATWVRIDDAQHQYGDTRVITGDPKTFGTVYLGARGMMVGTSSN